jgi:threonine/homoserine/homoserine lactone efflux protein
LSSNIDAAPIPAKAGIDEEGARMTEPVAFAVSALLLLFTPGPTNTLLFVSGAAAGFKRSLLLPLAELAGYLSALASLIAGVGPLVRTAPVLANVLKLGSVAWLVYLAITLWTRADRPGAGPEKMKPSRVYIATIMNPKSLVFGFVIVPYVLDRDWPRALPYIAALALFIAFAGVSWILAGGLLGRSVGRQRIKKPIERIGAVVLLAFAVTLFVSVVRCDVRAEPTISGATKVF